MAQLEEILDLPVVPFDSRECDHNEIHPPVSWQQYYGLRNAILRALRPFGTVGPMGECTINDDADGPPSPWPIECHDPDFYIISDQLNDTSLWIGFATEPKFITVETISALNHILIEMPPGWAIGIDVCENGELIGYILLFANKVMVKQSFFEGVRTIRDIVAICSKHKKPV